MMVGVHIEEIRSRFFPQLMEGDDGPLNDFVSRAGSRGLLIEQSLFSWTHFWAIETLQEAEFFQCRLRLDTLENAARYFVREALPADYFHRIYLLGQRLPKKRGRRSEIEFHYQVRRIFWSLVRRPPFRRMQGDDDGWGDEVEVLGGLMWGEALEATGERVGRAPRTVKNIVNQIPRDVWFDLIGTISETDVRDWEAFESEFWRRWPDAPALLVPETPRIYRD